MPPNIALLIGVLFIIFVFVKERGRNAPVSSAIILPLIWYAVAASRPIGVWLTIWGIPLPGGSMDPTEGSVVDRWFLTTLIIIGIYILARRRCDWNKILRENAWLLALFAFMAFSILWSDYPMVSLKRFIKSIGAAIMALIVLTEPKPMEAIGAVLRRCAYFLIPLSIITIRYFRNISISWDWSGVAESWMGIATSKNTLGQIAVTSTLIFLWERLRKRHDKEGRMIDFLYIMMSLYLLKGSDDALSMTSITLFAIGIFVLLSLRSMKLNLNRVKPFCIIICIVISSILFSVITMALNPLEGHSLLGTIIQAMERDPTLTGRTEIWSDVFAVASRNPMLGVGFGGFWIGSLVNIPWSEEMTWTLGQAHNGYVDAYLQLGWAGIFLLTSVIFSVASKIIRSFPIDFEYGRLRMTFFLLILFVNITESTFLRGDHNMWFLFLLVALFVPYQSDQITVARKRERPASYTETVHPVRNLFCF
jgi:O-antigen ligase